MITYICKYAPVEILEAFGTEVGIAEPQVTNFTQADTLMHPNMCSYVKAVLEDFESTDPEGMLFTTCCDSSRRLYDTLKRLHPDKFFFCFDLPRKVSSFTVSLYAEQMERLIKEYSAFSGKTFDAERLVEICAEKAEMQSLPDGRPEWSAESPPDGRPDRTKESLYGDRTEWAEESRPGDRPEWAEESRPGDRPEHNLKRKADLNVCLAGARPGPGVKQLIEDLGAHIALDLTCTGIAREYHIEADLTKGRDDSSMVGSEAGTSGSGSYRKEVLKSYAAALLGQIPCMRMAQVDGRAEVLLAQSDGIDGILYHTVKFCDIYSYEYTHFRQTLGLPIVKLETDATSQCAGQIRTRVEAFFESLRARKTAAQDAFCDTCMDGEYGASAAPRISKEEIAAERTGPSADSAGSSDTAASGVTPGTSAVTAPAYLTNGQGGSTMYIMGIDSGSTSTNAVIINEKKEILSYAVLRTGAKSAESAERIRNEVLEKAGLKPEDITCTVSTGYGRVSIPFADRNVTEISCHGRGAHFLNPNVRTILDIGGQDSKAIRLNDDGDVIDFVMNDKCAAGTGRFLEMMADTLEVGIEALGPLSLKSKEDVEISSMCSVFAESEVISLIAQNKEPADIARGIHKAIAGKAMSLLRKVGLEQAFMMTGGVAKNPGMTAVLEEMLGAPLYIYEEPEIVGALGAALYGADPSSLCKP